METEADKQMTLREQDSKRVADEAIEAIRHLANVIPITLREEVSFFLKEHRGEIIQSVQDGIDVALSSGTATSDAIRIGIENAFEGVLLNKQIDHPSQERG